MSPDSAPVRRDLARVFLTALRPALASGASASTRQAARDAAQMLGLAGLDRALSLLQSLGAAATPDDVATITGRILRLAADCEAAGDPAPFEAADRELAALVDEIEAYDWLDAEPEEPNHPAVATLPLDRVFDESLLAGEESRALASRLRLSAPVAATLRAVLDWLAPANLAVHSVRLRGEPSLLEVRLDSVRGHGIDVAHRALSAVGGNLGPALEDEGGPAHAGGLGWVVRVPTFAVRPSYLMVLQGGLRLAIPWHAVLRLRMLPPAELAGDAWRQGHPVLDFIATPSPNAIEYPVVLIAHGLKRGYFVADRLVWRLAAEPCGNEWGSPAPGLRETVRSEEGEVFWIAEPGRLLQHVPVPEPPARETPPRPEPEAPLPTLTDRDVQPLGTLAHEAPRPEPATPRRAPAAPAEKAAARGAAVPPYSPAPPAADLAPPSPRREPTKRLALVSEDSITARVFLTRMLFQENVQVEAVATAAELLQRLSAAPWDFVLVDADLPDAHGPAWLERARVAAAAAAPAARVVALVRDRADLDSARTAGVSLTLLKPIRPEDLARVLAAAPKSGA